METVTLYGGDVKLSFDPVKHLYAANGVPVEGSISGALKVINKPALIPWAVKLTGEYIQTHLLPGVAMDEVEIAKLIKDAKAAHRIRTEDAADLGTMGHEWIQQYLVAKQNGTKEPAYPVNEQLQNIVFTFLKFMGEHNVEVIEAERKLYSVERKCAGTADLVCKFEGELAILDWKTGSGIYPEYFLQMGGYDICYTEEMNYLQTPIEIKKHVIVNCSKTGELAFAVSDEVGRNREGFACALRLNQILANITKELKDGRNY